MNAPRAVHRFDNCELVPSERTLRIGGKQVTLGARAFDLLVALVERAGRVVSKDELLDAVWGRVIVEEANLHVHISALRKLLGPKAIATIPGRGYRFEARLADTDQPDAAPAQPAPPVADASARTHARQPLSPAQPPDLIGRDDDLATLIELLDGHRVVTIVGPGGIGKTRLARAALWTMRDRFADGAAMVELAALSDATLVPAAVATALGLPLGTSQDPAAAVVAALKPLTMLLALDNAEHVVGPVARIADSIVGNARAVTLLVTSQLPLRIAGEQVMRLGRLAVPETDEALAVDDALGYGAIRLFDERIRAVDRSFRLTAQNLPAVIAICRQLDGIALAIELAAARSPLVGLNVVAQRLDERFKLLRSGMRTAPTRQQTLQAAMDWSYGLLTHEQRIAFAQLGVFAGGFSLPLAQQVLDQPGIDEWGSVELLAELVDRSLVSIDPSIDRSGDGSSDRSPDGDGAPRYRLLETGRAYALDRLAESGDTDRLRARHAAAMRVLFEAAYAECWTTPENEFVARYEPELDNLRAALDWSMRHSAVDAIALIGASGRLWRWLSLHPEALSRSHAAAAVITADTPRDIAARLWESIAQLSGEISSVDSRPAARNALALYEQPGDDRGRYLALAHIAFSFRSGSDEAESAYATMRAIEDPRWPPSVRILGTKVRGGLASDSKRIDEARAAHEERLSLARAAGSEREINAALGNLADLALIAGDAADAVERGRQLLQRLGRRQMTTRAIALGNLLLALLDRKAIGEARQTQREFIETTARLGYMYVMYAADALALLAAHEKRWKASATILGYADAAYASQSQSREPNEAKARDRAEALLKRGADTASVKRWMAEGAALDPKGVCDIAGSRT